MLWVLAVVGYRIVRGESEEAEYQIVCERAQIEDAENMAGDGNIAFPPPNYTRVEEKIDYDGSIGFDAKVAPEESK